MCAVPIPVSKILDAAVVCSQRTGLGKTTMSDIIAESGLARTTVYRYCKTRDDIISQVVLRDIDYLIQQLEGIRAANDGDLETQLVEVLYFTLSEISSRPLLKALFSQDPTVAEQARACQRWGYEIHATSHTAGI